MNSSVKIGEKLVGDNHPVFIVAEIGINHNGSVTLAKQLIDVAVSCGCDAVKFQKRTVPVVYTESELVKPREVYPDIISEALKRGVLSAESVRRLKASNYQETTNGDLKWALELTHEEYAEINSYCKEKGIVWFASPWDEESVDFLETLNVPCHKIASPSLTDDGLLRHIRRTGKPVILSTGMSDLKMIEHAVSVLGTENLIIMHCTSFYSEVTADNRVLTLLNLKGIRILRERFNDVPIGFSGNDAGIMPTYATVAMGACAVEKHLTLNHAMWGSDQKASVEPGKFKDLCRMIRELEVAMGDGVIQIYQEEIGNMKKLRRK